jgi:hypothetical protein
MKSIHFVIIFILTLALAACSAPAAKVTVTPCPTSVSSSAGACPMPTKTPPALPAGAVFQVLLPDGKSVPFTPIDIKSLPLAQVTVDGKVEEGPRLLDVLTAAGIKEFSEVTFNGDTTLTLKKPQLDTQSTLVIASAARLAAPGLPPEQQVNGITTIRVK